MFYNENADGGRKKYIVFPLIVITLLCTVLLSACGRAPITLIGKTYILEQGTTMPTDVSNYVKGTQEELAKCVLDASKVNWSVVGSYTAEVIHPNKTVSFEVRVVDTTGPAVELYATDLTAGPGQVIDLYDVLKSVTDNTSFEVGFVDDITKADSEKVLSGSLTFSEAGGYNAEILAKDAYGNITVVPITVIVMEDKEPPVLTGVIPTIYATVGNPVDVLAGISASDNLEGDITNRIVADTSAVDFNTAGTYTAGISVKDGCGNETTASISIVVQDMSQTMNPGPTATVDGDFSQYSTEYVPFGFGSDRDPETNRPTGLQWYINHYGQYAVDFMQPESNYIFLTFDEGYEYGYTPQILDTLKEKNVKAVFFVTLPYAKENPELVQRMIDEGHVVGNHSATHPNDGLSTLSVEQQLSEVQLVHDYVLENFDYEMYLFRFPTGAFSEQSLAIVQSLGYRSVFWSFAHRDWYTDDQPDVAESLQNALDKAHGGAIYLLHAVSSTNTEMLGDFIDGCRAKGFEFGYYGKTN